MKMILNVFLGLVLPFLVKSQSFTIPTNPSLAYLLKTKNEISTINKTEKLVLFPLKFSNQQVHFNLIKNKNGLFALIDGTGQVYKATPKNKTKIQFDRIDSTYFFGNNFNAIKFSYDGIIYSFGGYGFWSHHGELSHFTPGSEWSIDKINKKYKTTNWVFNYLPKKSKIYYVEFPYKDESTNDVENKTSVVEFNILTKENTFLGKLNDILKLQNSYLNINIPAIEGYLIASGNEMILLNFSKNKVYKLINSKIKEELIGKAGLELQTTFEDEGKIFYTYNNDTTLRSISISMADFVEEPYPLYIPEINIKFVYIIIIVAFLISCAIILVILFKRKSMKSKIKTDKEETYSVDFNSNEFNSIEINLINKLIEKSNIDSHLSVDELNNILGIKKKTIEIQKRVRTEAINRINHKFNINFNLETKFIERTRSNDDKRYFNYIINKKNANIYNRYSK